MRKIAKDHKYKYEDGVIIDCFGDKMDSVDEYADEMQLLLDEVRNLAMELDSLKSSQYND